FFVFIGVIAPLWFRMNRDVSAYLHLRGAPRPGWPVLSLLAMGSGWLGTVASSPQMIVAATGWVAISVYNTCRRIERAALHAAHSTDRLLPPLLLVAVFIIFPLVLAHVQHVMNSLWRNDGEVLA
ncbi:MAG TPA: hypothetical protein VK875_03530, partial [Euzebyales bacterium]|nr:hypothetical protein [Euzebyales bacterium]